jgi:hypothetical protein
MNRASLAEIIFIELRATLREAKSHADVQMQPRLQQEAQKIQLGNCNGFSSELSHSEIPSWRSTCNLCLSIGSE